MIVRYPKSNKIFDKTEVFRITRSEYDKIKRERRAIMIFTLDGKYTGEILMTIAIVIIAYSIKKVLLKILHQKITDSTSFYRVRRIINYVLFAISALLIGGIWLKFGQSFSTYFGLISAGLAVALKDLVVNMAAWIFIIAKRPFTVGDRIEIAGVKGDVIDQRLFQFSVMEIGNWIQEDQSTGRIIHMPNYKVFTDHLANYTIGFEYIWNEISILLTFESEWKTAKAIFLKIAEKHTFHLNEEIENKVKMASKKYLILYKNLTPIVYTDVKESGVQLTIRYLCAPQQRRSTKEAIWEDILNIINESENISLAYPTMRMTLDSKINEEDHENH